MGMSQRQARQVAEIIAPYLPSSRADARLVLDEAWKLKLWELESEPEGVDDDEGEATEPEQPPG